jgi:type IV pilus assembly protein PilB
MRPDRKLLTVEDPIEYQMPGITQVQVNLAPRDEEKKVTFARALREFLRQDPDVILVGEIRDHETAAIGVQAALTGHLLLSTIHTNDSVGIITRLEDMGVEPYLISSTLVGGIAQRLVRRVCPGCGEKVEPSPDLLERFRKEGISRYGVFQGKGCIQCHHTGSKGRLAIYEILEVTPELRPLIASRAGAEVVSGLAVSQGMRTLYQDGLLKVAGGRIPYGEVLRVTLSG